MEDNNSNNIAFKIIEAVARELRQIDSMNSAYEIKQRINRILEFIELETSYNKTVFQEMLYSKVKETNGANPELNTYLYLLYRNFTEGKIPLNEAQKLYGMYLKEYQMINTRV